MENIRIICCFFLGIAFVLTLLTLYYDLSWKKQNPWWRQNDCKMHLSPLEQEYRQRERQKMNNVLMLYFTALFMIFGLMVFTLFSHQNGSFPYVGCNLFYLIPFVGAIFLALSGIQYRK